MAENKDSNMILFNLPPTSNIKLGKDTKIESAQALAFKTYMDLSSSCYIELITNDTDASTLIEHLSEANYTKQCDPVHGHYPFILYKHYWLTKDRMLDFCALKFNINAFLTAKDLGRVHYYQRMLTKELHRTTKLN